LEKRLRPALRPKAKPEPPSDDVLCRIAYNVRTIRKRRGWSKRELNRRCGFEEDYIWCIEVGLINISLEHIEFLAAELSCTELDLCWFLPGDPRFKTRG